MVTQAPATAFACFQLATLAQKKRCLGTASQSLGVLVRCRLTPSALVPASPMVTQTANAACSQLGRERCRSFSTATQVCTPLRGRRVSDFASLRLTPDAPCVPLQPSSAVLHSLCAPSVARKSGV